MISVLPGIFICTLTRSIYYWPKTILSSLVCLFLHHCQLRAVWTEQRVPTGEQGIHFPLHQLCTSCPNPLPTPVSHLLSMTQDTATQPLSDAIFSQSPSYRYDLTCPFHTSHALPICATATWCFIIWKPYSICFPNLLSHLTVFQKELESFCIDSNSRFSRDHYFSTPWRLLSETRVSGIHEGKREIPLVKHIDELYLDISCKWNHTICGLWHITQFSLLA